MQVCFGQITESNGLVLFEAENISTNVPRTITGTNYFWTNNTGVGGYTGTGSVVALPNDGTTVLSSWTNTSPEIRYTINFSNTGTYYVWLRAFAETTENLGVYVGLNSNSSTASEIDLAKPGVWAWVNTASTTSPPVAITVSNTGTNTFHIWMRDAGFRLDRVLLTRNANFSAEPVADFWRKQNIYQIFTDRFFDGEPTNNNYNSNYSPATGNAPHGGDFKGIEQKLDYIKALGATAIWISPVVRNANGDYHGYAGTDFYNVEPRFGSMADLQRLIGEAHKRGILVVNDIVVNHGSTWVDSGQAGWGTTFLSPPSGYSLKYNSGSRTYAFPFDNASLTSNFGNTNLANIFHNNCGIIPDYGVSAQVELGELSSLDDFRTESSYVRQKMGEIYSFWISQAGFDGFRIDTVKHVEMGFWDAWCPVIRSNATAVAKPNFFQFGEVYDGNDAKCGSYTGTKTTSTYKMESVLDYPLYYQINSVFAGTGNTKSLEDRYGNLNTNNYDAGSLMSLVTFIDNHDQPRFLSTNIGGNTSRLELALFFLYTSRGIPCLYYGTEQDFDGGPDPWDREDMFDGQFEGGPSNGDNFNMTAPRFKLVAKLNNLRRLYPALCTGSHDNLWNNPSGPGLFAYSRTIAGSQQAYIVFNTASTSQSISNRPTMYTNGTILVNALNPSDTVTVVAGTDGIPAMTLAPYAYKIYVAQGQYLALNPLVESITPSHDAASVPTSTVITVNFSRGMNTNTVQGAFSTTPSTTGTFSWTNSNSTVTYTPSSSLTGTSLQTVKIAATATDSNGLVMFAPFESRFTTAAASGSSRPSVNGYAATNVTNTTASLTASVTPNGAATTVNFEYGTSSTYGISTTGQSVGSGTSATNVTANLTGLNAGVNYHARVVASNSVGVTYGGDFTFTTTSTLQKPTVTTLPATLVGNYSGNMNADVNPNGNPVSYYFEYGVQANVLTNTASAQPNTNSLTGVWGYASPLSPETTYYYNIVVTSGTDVIRGSVQSFSTLPVKPSVTTLSAVSLQTNAATLQGTVNPNGTATTFWFEYGTNSSLGSLSSPVNAGASNAISSQAIGITGLQAAQVYYYRAVASNSFGATFGSTQSFQTASPAPSVLTGGATILSSTTANLSGVVNPNGLSTGFWVEYGTNPALGQTTKQTSTDDAESYTGFSYNNNGGIGFGPFYGYTTTGGSRGGTYLVNSSTGGRQIDGANSFGVYAGSSTTRGSQSGWRALNNPRSSGVFTLSVRFDVDNAKAFCGFNLKSQTNNSFGNGELVSVGIMPASGNLGGNNGLLVTDRDGQRMITFGTNEIRGALVDLKVTFDGLSGSYVLGGKLRGVHSDYLTLSGMMKQSGVGVNVAAFGFLNGNCSGANNQNLIFDSLQLVDSDSIGSGLSSVPVTTSLTGLASNSLYHYRVAASSSAGTNTGTVQTFSTGPDLTLLASHTNEPWGFGASGRYSLVITNVGAASSSGTVTVKATLPPGLTPTNLTGTGWTATLSNLTCIRANSLANGTSYPAILLDVIVDTNKTTSLTPSFTVSGGGDLNTNNNTVNDPTSLLGSLDNWKNQWFGSAAGTAAAADTNSYAGDGIQNLVKYALGMDPTMPATNGLPAIKLTNNKLALTFNRQKSATDIVYEVQATGDLFGFNTSNGIIWSSTNTTNAYKGGTNLSYPETVEDTVPVSSTNRRFMRLQISRP